MLKAERMQGGLMNEIKCKNELRVVLASVFDRNP